MIGINMSMPKNCRLCPIERFSHYYGEVMCPIKNKPTIDSVGNLLKDRPDWCPLIDLSQYEDDHK